MKTLVHNNDIRNEGREEGRRETLYTYVLSCRKMNISDELILKNLINDFNMSENDAKELMAKNN